MVTLPIGSASATPTGGALITTSKYSSSSSLVSPLAVTVSSTLVAPAAMVAERGVTAA